MSLSIYNMHEEEITEANSHLKIENEIECFASEEKENILSELKEIFVIGNPRVWWLSLKYKPTSYVFEKEQTYTEIVNFFDKEEVVWFIVDDDKMLLYKTKVSHVIDIIGECTCFEYNIISQNHDRFLCETDHGDFLFIDLR